MTPKSFLCRKSGRSWDWPWAPRDQSWNTGGPGRGGHLSVSLKSSQMSSPLWHQGRCRPGCFFPVMKLGSGEVQETIVVGKGCTTAELHQSHQG